MAGCTRLASVGRHAPRGQGDRRSGSRAITCDRVENWNTAERFVLVPLTDVLLFPPMDVIIRATGWLLLAVVALVLLLACTNLASSPARVRSTGARRSFLAGRRCARATRRCGRSARRRAT